MVISIGQVKAEDKTNESKTIPDLLELIDIKGCTITIDAAGTYMDIAEKHEFNIFRKKMPRKPRTNITCLMKYPI